MLIPVIFFVCIIFTEKSSSFVFKAKPTKHLIKSHSQCLVSLKMISLIMKLWRETNEPRRNKNQNALNKLNYSKMIN